MKRILLTILLVPLYFIGFTQGQTVDQQLEDKYLQQEDLNYDQVYETMIQYINDPLDINSVTQSELESLGILDPFQIQNFFDYRNSTGGFISLLELQSIDGFDMATIQSLLPFVRLKKIKQQENIIKRIINNQNNYLITQSGYYKSLDKSTSYVGQNNPLYFRYRNARTNDFSVGFTLKNDIGESINLDPSTNYYITDQSSFHFTLYSKNKIKALSIGDYKLQFGQGLIAGGGFNLGKGGETILCIKQNNTGIIPNTSGTELGSFRGIAICVPIKRWDCTGFVSFRKIDGNIDSSNLSFTKITIGYHRTPLEIQRRKNINESNAGFNFHYSSLSKKFQLGVTGLNTWFEKIWLPASQVYNQFQFKGKSNSVIGSDINYLYKNFNFFGELAISKSGGKGIVVGVLSSLHKSVDAVILVRNYEKDFHSFYSNAFSEGTTSSNEKGWYSGLKIRPVNRIEISCYFDRFQFPWLKYQTYGISRGYEYLLKINYTPSKNSELSFQIREENKELNDDKELNPYYTLENRIKRNYQIIYRTQINPFRLGSRVQFSSINFGKEESNGFAIIQDIEFEHRRFLIACRLAMFDTDDYDNRQYVYERNFIYNFSITSYYGKGTRFYTMVKYRINKNLDFWLRYAKTSYEDEKDKNNSLINGMLFFKI